MTSKSRLVFLLAVIALLALAACSGEAVGSRNNSSETVGSRNNSSEGSTEVASLPDTGPTMAKLAADESPAARGATSPTSDVAGVCLSPQEAELARLINEYRVTKGLPAIALSKSLTLVAQQHAWDSVNNSNAWPAPPAGQECNMHSWSGNVNPALQEGTWTAVCYTPDHANMNGMHRKPGEIAGYPGDGFENSHWASAGANPAGALLGWQNSPGHNAVITEQNGWGPFLALGVGMSGQYAHMWVGEVADPAGAPPLCDAGTVEQPTAEQPTAEAAATEASTAEAATVEATAGAGVTTGEILNQGGTVADGASAHTFDVVNGQRYSVVITPSSTFDVAAEYTCTAANASQSASIDSGWAGAAESFSLIAPGNGSCTVLVSGYDGSTGDYTVVIVAE